MEELELYVKEILITDELVSIPGLGGFISKHVPSNFDPSTHIFTPPHKQIAFNERLNIEGDKLHPEPSDVPDLAQDQRGPDRPDAPDGVDRRRLPGQFGLDPDRHRFDLHVELDDVRGVLERELLRACRTGSVGVTAARICLALVAVRRLGAPPGNRSCNRSCSRLTAAMRCSTSCGDGGR